MLAPIFPARVLDGGLLVLDRPRDYGRYLRMLKGQFVEVIVRKRRTQRSLDQNAYLHAVPIPILAEHFGYTIPEMKLVLMGECFGWHPEKITGRDLPLKPSTSEMSVDECSRLIDWVIPWAATNHDVLIPLPNEVDYPDEVA